MDKWISCITHLECALCGRQYDCDSVIRVCKDDAKPLLARYDLSSAAKTLQLQAMSDRESSMWRYREVLPVRDPANVVSLGEGWTPMLSPSELRRKLRAKNIFLKDESGNPTGSFKARGMSAAVSRAMELGVRNFAVPSAGNAAGALSAYAAAAGASANVFVPDFTPLANLAECTILGASVHLVDGYITDAGKLSVASAEQHNWFDISTLREPYRAEGKKTMGYEIVEQLNGVPDAIVYPTGGGTGIVGIWKAFAEMQEMGWIGRERPRMFSVQAAGCAPIARAFANGDEFAAPVSNPSTLATGLLVPAAIGDFIVLRAIRESAGGVLTVTDDEMLEGVKDIAMSTGVVAAPEGGATVAGMRQLLASGEVGRDARVVLLNTGSGFKYLDKMKALYQA